MFRRKLYKEVVAKQINKNNFDATECMPTLEMVRSGREGRWACSGWRKEGQGATQLLPSTAKSSYGEERQTLLTSPQVKDGKQWAQVMTGKVQVGYTEKKNSFPQEWYCSGTATGEVMGSPSLETLQTDRTRPWAS